MKFSPIISAKELQEILNQENIIIVDAGSGGNSYDNYLEKHLENALYVDLSKDLAEVPEDAKNGGRHPLPSLEKFAKVLQNLGINRNSHLIICDNKNSTNAAPRFWWMLKSVGIENVQVLDGGLQSAESEGLKLSNEITKPKKSAEKLDLKNWKLPLVDIDFIEKNSENPDFKIIDVRDKDRYDGKTEPIDKIAGHIPDAENIPFTENMNEDGTLKKPELIREKYQKEFQNISTENIAIHCGSGVTACNTLLALDYAGLEIPNLYVGSWSEWSRNNKKMATNI
ncbi:thiosulfate/3-mercaptopyruvate sulfurtransferase [Halpernia humi]|uniref:Thiosulfate/3-mercaptopyruvate sulfurtransferase n=1 Tax=Halpernia humi TaxID=493375 RepID=A0A1H5XZZ1_9FLAO|nr:sulfurtransferase [Halpernia humi]SEG17115.1 thiosulfate/3-mercaptopyruvate sulfurtransferase [Halpernia humi]